MNPEYVTFRARGDRSVILEGEILDGGGAPCIVSHPHPFAGGDMEHPVVVALWMAAAGRGFKALRYNFRGVGESTGGLEHAAELATADLGGAMDALGGGSMAAIGYSYGARTTLAAMHEGFAIERAVLVALPTKSPANRAAMSNLMLGRKIKSEEWLPYPDAERAGSAPNPVLVIAGDLDPLVDFDELRAAGVEPQAIEGVNHFFSRRLGNQAPDAADLAALSEHALDFLSVC
ncbi:MAG: hypothetical protein OER88_13120 [Planctomycetota bacterium]|nr:hypothetical protein [Planctomycetota bacterium]